MITCTPAIFFGGILGKRRYGYLATNTSWKDSKSRYLRRTDDFKLWKINNTISVTYIKSVCKLMGKVTIIMLCFIRRETVGTVVGGGGVGGGVGGG